jgi:hypothetical protein
MRIQGLRISLLFAAAALLSVSGSKAADKKPASAKPTPKAAPKAAPTTGRGATPSAPGRGGAATTAGRGASPAAGGRGAAPNIARSGAPRPGERVSRTPNGGEIHRGPNGQIHEVHARGMEIHHGPGGSRTIYRERPGHVMVVSNRFGHGYIERPYAYRGVAFVHRTYYVNGVAYVGVYRPYVIGGVGLAVYAPPVFFAPAFYGWAYNPWVAPVVYPWGWAGNPWFAYYGGYFTPYPAYATPALWLTDYMVAQTLQAAYVERAAELANAQAAAAPAPLSPDVKQAISDEVRRQVALENSEAGAGQAPPDPGSSGVARMLADSMPHVFVVSTPLDLTSNVGGCPVTEGDVLQLNPGTPPNSPSANLVVLASKGPDCRKGATVSVGVADLQDMQNHMRETIDKGLNELQQKQGQNGLPAAPASAAKPPVQTAFAAVAPPPDPNVATELSEQTKEADVAEREVLSQETAAPGGTPAPAPAAPAAPAPAATTLNLGQSPDEVKAALGEPKNIVDLGSKKIYIYKDLKVTFNNGKVTDIQ